METLSSWSLVLIFLGTGLFLAGPVTILLLLWWESKYHK